MQGLVQVAQLVNVRSRVHPGAWRTDHEKARRAWPRGPEHWFLVEVRLTLAEPQFSHL